ncbi:MAG: HAMP domain-containing sensor histidine kinase [Bacteroidales bacterium]|nr:HAMP domain-containing sensor histidine kinase [Bacteroidales bacterium]
MKVKNKRLIAGAGVMVAFALAATLIALLNESRNKKAILSANLEAYCDIVARCGADSASLSLVPGNLSITVISESGDVLLDSRTDASGMENHLQRPEVRKCLTDGTAYAIRRSGTVGKKYFYFAKNCSGIVVRCARPYEVDLARFFRLDWMLVISLALALCLALIVFFYLYRHYLRQEEAQERRERSRLKHELTGNISHELKTPVSSIRGYLETLVNHPDMDPAKKELFLQRSYLQSVRLSELIRDISIITKLEEAPQQFATEPVNLKNVFEEVSEELAEARTEAGIEIESDIPPVCIHANYQLIHSILRNLLENSIRYAGKGARVRILFRKSPDGTFCFDYSDNGVGVEEGELEHIFERFYRLSRDRSRNCEGSGLGLSIIRNAVLFHKGEIQAYKREGGGLGFRFTLHDIQS